MVASIVILIGMGVVGLLLAAISADRSPDQEIIRKIKEEGNDMSFADKAACFQKTDDVEKQESLLYGPLNQAMICPHCQSKGRVRTKSIEKKIGISGGKATAAVLTGGLSVVATGLSRKEQKTKARCGECKNKWEF